jgi:MFS family permease
MADVAGMGAIWRTLNIPNYRNYTAGNFASQLGMWLQRIAVGWLTWELTKSPTWLGIIAFADFFPNIVFAPLAGALADRMDRLRAIRFYMVISAFLSGAIAVLTVTGLITIEALLVLVLANGIAMSFNYPVRLSIIHALVGHDALTTAISINAIVFNVARIGGPALAGIIIEFWGIGPAVSFTVVADILFVLALYCVTVTSTGKPKEKKSAREIPEEIIEGFRYVWGHPGLGPLLFILAFYCIFARPFIDLFPGFADAVFGRGADALAMLTSMLGVGSLFGSVFLARLQGVAGLTRILIANVLLMSLAVIGFAATKNFWFALACTGVAGIAIVMIGVIEQTLLQASVDGSMRGRVLSFYTLIARGCPSLGALLMGTLASYAGLQLPVAGGAVLCIGLWYWAWRRRDSLSRSLEVRPDEKA